MSKTPDVSPSNYDKIPHQLWWGIAMSYFNKGWGTHPISYTEHLQGKFYISPKGKDKPRKLEGFTEEDYAELFSRGMGKADENHKWGCGFELSPEGLVVDSE